LWKFKSFIIFFNYIKLFKYPVKLLKTVEIQLQSDPTKFQIFQTIFVVDFKRRKKSEKFTLLTIVTCKFIKYLVNWLLLFCIRRFVDISRRHKLFVSKEKRKTIKTRFLLKLSIISKLAKSRHVASHPKHIEIFPRLFLFSRLKICCLPPASNWHNL
jgi:hypothetical protein